jgi:hypothetical protein
MTSKRRASLWVSCLLVLSASAGFAQSDPASPSDPPPAHLSIIEGQAYIDREGRSDPATANVPLLDGDRLRTEEGRLEVILPDGSLLHMDRDTTVDVMAADLLRLLRGRVYVIVRGIRDPQRAVRYQIDAPVASVQTGGPGEFRVWSADTTRGREVELAVFRGQATIGSDNGAEDVQAGERSVVRDGLAPSAPQYFNSARWDEFDRWSVARRDESVGGDSAQYLPSELTVYASTFDRYGTWRYEGVDGAVWYPTVAADWRPYSVGYWRSYPAWGSFWIGGDPWGWPTHHYGYWGFSFGLGWYWRPEPVFGPAWVYWAYSPGYVSWCPLGRHGYPVFGHFGVHGGYYGNHVDPWRGWTVVPRQHFGRPMPVHRVAVDGNRLDPAARGAFAARRDGPGPDRAVPRPQAGGIAVPRTFPGSGTAQPRSDAGYAMPRAGAIPRGGVTAAVPRTGGGRALPDRPARLNPDEAARVFAGGGTRAAGTATRRSLPAAPAYGSAGPRTEAPSPTPDVTAFGTRRERAVLRSTPDPGSATTIFGSGVRARDYPRAAPGPAQTSPGLSRRQGGWPESGPTPPVHEIPYIRGGGDSYGVPAGQAYPRSAERPSQAPPREIPYIRGGGDSYGVPAGQAFPRESPAVRGNGGGAPERSARPRDGAGSGMPASPSYRRGGSDASSAPPSAPRYNPGSGTSQPRSGGSSSPPPRGRGGNPD